ncbi:MAG: alpha-2-macroglobulin family protein [Myxococcota bacterium]|nr:alpha-2-macroglobulin family protein [Myxococcota bacterium]
MSRRIWPLLLLLLIGAAAVADPETFRIPFRPAQVRGVVIVPDAHLRRWDPVTVFFPRSVGPLGGGPEDNPSRHLSDFPDHPGAFTWLDGKTLQFRPAEPWPPLSRLTWAAGGESVRLNTLMAPPIQTVPADGADGLEPVESITLTFTDPLDVGVLERMLRIELRDLPGVDAASARWLDADDFTVKPLPRASADAPARYELALEQAIGAGVRARVHFSLSVDATGEPGETFADLLFSTAPGFRPVGLGCGARRYPLTPQGSVYAAEQAIDCGDTAPMVVVELSAEPAELSVVDARNLLRFSPPLDDLAVAVRGRRVEVTGDFARDTLYRVRLVPAALSDARGRPLQVDGESALSIFFPQLIGYLKLTTGAGISERGGPQRIPLEGRGVSQVDLRIHRIDPLDRGLWPFPSGGPVSVEEDTRPAGPGERPPREPAVERLPSVSELAASIQTLGAPLISEVVSLPDADRGSSAAFGLDIEDHLSRIAGTNKPGTYLVGVRSLDTGSSRSWMRLQVTDLSLTTLEAAEEVNLVVSSLSRGTPVSGATVRIEGTVREPGEETTWAVLFEGRTDGSGVLPWSPPGVDDIRRRTVRRIVVTRGEDTLVLNPLRPPQVYQSGQWRSASSSWLQWGFGPLERRGEKPVTLCHVFSERPVYRPDQPVHLKGYMRTRDKGQLTRVTGQAALVVDGPGDLSWRYPGVLSDVGGLYERFAEDKRPTGTYFAWLETPDGDRCGRTEFSLEDYVVPRFEVLLHGPDEAPLDVPFEVTLTASYYAGGRAAGRPIRWRVSQLPYTWQPPNSREGFLYSSDGRFSRGMSGVSAPEFSLSATTDEQGSAVLPIDPTAELTAEPRTWLVEATVTGEDDQTVTTTHRIDALPPFVLGLKVPRYQERSDAIPAEVLVAAADGTLIADQSVTLRLLQRQWHSHLQVGDGAADFTDGAARYITDSVDVLLSEQQLTSASAPVKLRLPIAEAGVYIVQLESHDRMGRASTVSVDLFAGGDGAVSWEKPEAGVFSLQTDAGDYAPGKTATVVLKSPFQSARALAVIETPRGNRYQWLTVRGGQATLRLRVEEDWVPQVPVHVVLMRGRIPGDVVGGEDLGRPTTVAASTTINVQPAHHRLDLTLTHPERALPGARVPVTIGLKDHRGRPTAGEVTLWMVDAAVLALGRESVLDPVPSFIRSPRSWLSVRDTRNLVLGLLPWSVNPGGDEAEELPDDLFERATVRRNFDPVPYYNAAIAVPRSGTITVPVELSDSLTTFRVRAKAAAGDQQFGHATGNIAVRLPVVVQPDLPRFVRPGDRFDAGAIGRVVEGAEGAGRAQLSSTGLSVAGGAQQSLDLSRGEGSAIVFPVTVHDDVSQVQIAVALERASDGASDAFSVTLPVRPDQREVVRRTRQTVAAGASADLPMRSGDARGVERRVLVTTRAELLEVASGAGALLDDPHGSTASRLAKARAWLATATLADALSLPAPDDAVRATLDWLPQVIDSNGLVAFWPGGSGTVSLTAWTVHFLVEAEAAGHTVDPALMRSLTTTLTASLRSDYARFVQGESWSERTWALSALAAAGRSVDAYFSEAARSAQFLGAEGIAEVLLAGAAGGQVNTAQTRELVETLMGRIRFRLERGESVYDGLSGPQSASGLLLPSEVRALSEVIRALLAQQPDHPALPALTDALLARASTDGWGSASTDSAALRAVADILRADRQATPELTASLSTGGRTVPLIVGFGTPAVQHSEATGGPAQITVSAGEGALLVQTELRYTPTTSGAQVAPRADGFVVSRTLSILQPAPSPPERRVLEDAGQIISLARGSIVEEHVQLVSPADHHHVALIIPLAAGMEPLNPRLATAPPEASPTGQTTASPDFVDWRDDHVALYFDALPAGTWDVYFRTRAAIPGTFTQPPASAELLFERDVSGNSAGASMIISK